MPSLIHLFCLKKRWHIFRLHIFSLSIHTHIYISMCLSHISNLMKKCCQTDNNRWGANLWSLWVTSALSDSYVKVYRHIWRFKSIRKITHNLKDWSLSGDGAQTQTHIGSVVHLTGTFCVNAGFLPNSQPCFPGVLVTNIAHRYERWCVYLNTWLNLCFYVWWNQFARLKCLTRVAMLKTSSSTSNMDCCQV